MIVDLLWLLLPVAAASGWLMAQLRGQKTSVNLFPDYFKGLNYLLNEEPDKAIDVFIKLIEIDSDTVETHLALGVLFRRRGEVNRAIRIHQNLIKKVALHPQQRSLALFELGKDYRHAGLLDRAETLFQELVEADLHKISALHQLLEIYQQEHDWNNAIATAQQLASIYEEPIHVVIAQYYCEQAEVYLRQQQYDVALQVIQQALKTDSNCVRASLLEGNLALNQQKYKQAILAFKRIEQQDSDYLSEVVEPLQVCYEEIGQQSEFTDYLWHMLDNYGGVATMLMLANIIKQQKNEQQAVDFIVEQIHKHPSLRGLEYLLGLVLSKTDCITREHLLLLKDLTTQLLQNKPAYKCNQCGFSARKLYWQCPSCKQWNTFKSVQGINRE